MFEMAMQVVLIAVFNALTWRSLCGAALWARLLDLAWTARRVGIIPE